MQVWLTPQLVVVNQYTVGTKVSQDNVGGGEGGGGNKADYVEMTFFMFEVLLFLKSVQILELLSYVVPQSFFALVVYLPLN